MNLRASRWSMLFVVVTIALPSLATAQPACQPGRFASGATGTCEECNAGLYQPANGQTACFSCEAGRFTDTPARTACDACGPGRYQGFAGATVCNSCDAGTFRDATGQTSCATCEPGRFSDVTGSTVCQECAIGKYGSTHGSSSCLACDPGFVAARGSTVCRACASGEVPVFVGGDTCKSCSPGKYSATAGGSVCDACPPGKFSGVTVDALGDAHYASTCTAPNAYSCYKTKDLKNPKWTVVPTTVTDTYVFTVEATFTAPAMVCAPVDIGSGVEDASARQCCYKVKQPALPKPHPRVETKDGTFTGSQLELLKSQLICEPCGADPLP